MHSPKKNSRPVSRASTSKDKLPTAKVNLETVWSNNDTMAAESGITNNDFNSELSKESKSKGSWQEDYYQYCTTFQLTPCPFLRAINQSNTPDVEEIVVELVNCRIDQANFRSAILAMTTLGSKVSGIRIHASQLTPQNIIDLSLGLSKLCYISSVRLEYLTFDNSHSLIEYADAYKTFLNSEFSTNYLSFKGSKLGDIVCEGIIISLATNSSIRTLNLSDCALTNMSAENIINCLKSNVGLEGLSIGKNSISNDILQKLYRVIVGSPSTNDDATNSKNISKKSADRLKKIKDANRKRKKQGLLEFEEFETLDRIIKGPDGKLVVANRSIKFLDVSFSSINEQDVKDFAELFVNDIPSLTQYTLTVRVNDAAQPGEKQLNSIVTLLAG